MGVRYWVLENATAFNHSLPAYGIQPCLATGVVLEELGNNLTSVVVAGRTVRQPTSADANSDIAATAVAALTAPPGHATVAPDIFGLNLGVPGLAPLLGGLGNGD